MPAWLRRFSVHLVAAVGATSIFVAAAAAGAHETRQQPASAVGELAGPAPGSALPAQRKPGVRSSPSPAATTGAQSEPTTGPAAAARASKVNPERSISGTVQQVTDGSVQVVGSGGRELRITPLPGALIRLNGKTARLDALQPGDRVVILGQLQTGPGNRFLAHAITVRRT
jgi:hypothetical protein